MNDRIASFAAGVGFAGIMGLALKGTWAGAMVETFALVLSAALVLVGVLDWWYDHRT